MFYRPNTMRAEELSRNPVANALAVTFLMVSEQVPDLPSQLLHSLYRHTDLVPIAAISQLWLVSLQPFRIAGTRREEDVA